jgi:hypothetical protein
MRNPLDRTVDRWRKQLARRRYMPRPHRRATGTTAKIAIVALVTIVAIAAVLELRGGDGDARAFLEHAGEEMVPPFELLASAARRNQIVLLSDLSGSPSAKRFAAEAIDSIARGVGLDAVVLEVGSDQQRWVDLYLERRPEDASILLTRPALLQDVQGTGRDYLEIYRTVWRLNDELGADRAIRIIAADLPEWGTAVAAPSQAALLFGRRDAYMVQRVQERILTRNRRARLLFFVDGLHVLRGQAQAQTGGTAPVPIQWLAGRLRGDVGSVYSVLLDAPPVRTPAAAVASYRGTVLHELIRRQLTGAPDRFALRVGDAFDFARNPIRIATPPGLTFDLLPRDFRLRDQVDAYIFLAR